MTIGLAGPPQPWWCLARAAPSRMRPRKRGRLPSLEGQRGSDPGHRSRRRRGTSAEPSRTRSSTGCRSGRRRSGNRSCPRSSGSTGAVALEDNRRRRSSLEVQHPRALRQARSRHRSPRVVGRCPRVVRATVIGNGASVSGGRTSCVRRPSGLPSSACTGGASTGEGKDQHHAGDSSHAGDLGMRPPIASSRGPRMCNLRRL